MKKFMILVLVIVALACMPTKAEAARVYDQTGMKATTEEIREQLASEGWDAQVCSMGNGAYYVYATCAYGTGLSIEGEMRFVDGQPNLCWANEIAWWGSGNQTTLATWNGTEWTVTEEGAAWMLAHKVEF